MFDDGGMGNPPATKSHAYSQTETENMPIFNISIIWIFLSILMIYYPVVIGFITYFVLFIKYFGIKSVEQ